MQLVKQHLRTCSVCRDIADEAGYVYKHSGPILAITILGPATATVLNFTAVPTATAAVTGLIASVFASQGGKALVAGLAIAASVLTLGSLLQLHLGAEDPEYQAGAGSNLNSGTTNEPNTDNHGSPNPTPDAAEQKDTQHRVDHAPTASVPHLDLDHADSSETSGKSSGGTTNDLGSNSQGGLTENVDQGSPEGNKDGDEMSKPDDPVNAPEGPTVPEVIDDLPHTLREPNIRIFGGPPEHYLTLQGRDAEPGATIRVLLISWPTDGGQAYGTQIETQASDTGYWSLQNIGGIVPLNVTISLQQLTQTEASPWVTVIENESFDVTVSADYPRDYTGVYGWHARGWPGASWGLRKAGDTRPVAAGTFSGSGDSVIPVPPGSDGAEYEFGYWAKGRFEPTEKLKSVR